MFQKQGIKTLTAQHNLRQVFGPRCHLDVVNEGWAAVFIQEWADQNTERQKKKSLNKLNQCKFNQN